MNIQDFDYTLPEELIAMHPAEPRDHSRLLVVDRKAGSITHHHFYELPEFLNTGDMLVVNNTKVIPARLFGNKKPGGMKVEIFLIEKIEESIWKCMVRPGKKIQKDEEIVIEPKKFTCKILDFADKGERIIKFFFEGSFEENLEKYGVTPLPPYILKARKHILNITADKLPPEEPDDREHYQTVYANVPGSVAAPTAGLHFTDGLISKLKQNGIEFANVTLHVSAGTFLPIKSDTIEEHKMHTELFSISGNDAAAIQKAKSEGRRIIPVGTTSLRTLESAALNNGLPLKAMQSKTDIFIFPGFEFKLSNAMITNFHLPKSTLLILVSAFAGYELIMKAYEIAVKEKYRFYSYGDAMLII